MGHIHLGVLPQSRKWRAVVELLGSDAADEDVFAASARAVEADLIDAAQSAVFVEAVRLLLSIPLAARRPDFGQALRDADLTIRDAPGLFDITIAASERLDQMAARSRSGTDLGEIASRALISTLGTSIGDGLPGLFDATSDDVRAEARKLSWPRGISELSRRFFGHLVAGSLSSWLDRTLALHVGPGARFASAGERGAFDVALAQYSAEATRIVQEFSAGWFGKTVHAQGRITPHDAKVFGAVALKKIVAELRRKRGDDD